MMKSFLLLLFHLALVAVGGPADVVEQVVHLYLVLVNLQKQVNVSVQSHFLSQTHHQHVAAHQLMGTGCRIGNYRAN
jgi:hypothetical protein